MKVSFSRLASQDLQSIVSYIAKDDLNAAIALIDDIEAFCFGLLADNPALGKPYGKAMRQAIKRGYRIIYQTTGNNIEIIRILHPARNHQNIMSGE